LQLADHRGLRITADDPRGGIGLALHFGEHSPYYSRRQWTHNRLTGTWSTRALDATLLWETKDASPIPLFPESL
jgi:hypothetical protein